MNESMYFLLNMGIFQLAIFSGGGVQVHEVLTSSWSQGRYHGQSDPHKIPQTIGSNMTKKYTPEN